MSDTALNAFSQGCATYLSTSIFPVIIKNLQLHKGVTVTDAELTQWTNAPVSRGLQPAMSFTGAVPAPVTTTTTSTTGAKAKTGKATGPKTASEAVLLLNPDGTYQTSTSKPFKGLGKSCIHFFETGTKNKGKVCGRDVVAGTEFCGNKSHKNKPGSKTGVKPGLAPTVDTVEDEDEGEKEAGGLNVEEYDLEKGLYKDTSHGFIVKPEGDIIIVIGKERLSDNTIQPLNENDIVIAKSMDLYIPEVGLTTQPVQMPQPIQQMPQPIQQMPQPIQLQQPIQQMPQPIQQMPQPIQMQQMPQPMQMQQIPQQVQQTPSFPRPQLPIGIPPK